MKKLVCLLLCFFLGGCGDKVKKEDNEFASELLKESFPKGASFEQVNYVFMRYNRNIELNHVCEAGSDVCAYSAIGVIPAPGND